MKRRTDYTEQARLELDAYTVMLERIALQYARRVSQAMLPFAGPLAASAAPMAADVRLDDVLPLQTVIGKLLLAVGQVILPSASMVGKVIQAFGRANGRHVSSLLAQHPDKPKRIATIDLWRSESWLEQAGQVWSTQGAALITRISQDMADRAANAVLAGVKAGLRHEALAGRIEAAMAVPAWRARLIARDQVSKWNSQLTARRFQDSGVQAFIWRTARDRRVVGRPGGLYPEAKSPDKHGNHYEREGRIFLLERERGGLVELVGRGSAQKRIIHADWDDGLPGEPIQCRCWAEPVL